MSVKKYAFLIQNSNLATKKVQQIQKYLLYCIDKYNYICYYILVRRYQQCKLHQGRFLKN